MNLLNKLNSSNLDEIINHDPHFIDDEVSKILSTYRYEHTKRVALLAYKLALKNHYNPNYAYLAGMLHDITKEWSDEDTLNYLKDKEYDKKAAIEILHPYTAYYYLKENTKLNSDILNAIKAHSDGSDDSLLAKIIYLADKNEEGRRYLCKHNYELAFKDLNKAFIQCKKETEDYNNHRDETNRLKNYENYLKTFPRSNRILIIAAMDEEIKALLDLVKYEEKELNTIKYYQFNYYNKECMLIKSGIGKVNAALNTSYFIAKFDFDYVLNIGSAGSLKEDIKQGEIVIARRVAYHDFKIPNWERSFNNERISFSASPYLLTKARLIIPNAIYGDMVSGDSFIHKKGELVEIKQFFPSAISCDMEASAIARVCDFFKIEWLIIRSISDNIYDDHNELIFDEFLTKASQISANNTLNLIKTII